MKKFRWILLSGLLVAATSVAQAQPSFAPSAPGGPGGPSALPSADGAATTGTVGDTGSISNAPTTTTTTTTTGLSPDASFVPADDAAMDGTADMSSMPNTGGEPMIAILAGLSIAGAAIAMRRKVTA